MFDPSIAGVGSHEITYLLNDGSGCVNQIKQTLTVTNLIQRAWPLINIRCLHKL